MTAEQLILDLPHRPALGAEDFLVSDCNLAAVRLIDAWPAWRDNVQLLIGPAASGKTHLARAAWLLDRGMDPNVTSATDADGFGGYTAIFSTVVSQRNFWVNYGKGEPDEARFTRLLLDRGADPNARASLRQRLEEGHGGGPLREYRDVTPLGWGDAFEPRVFVSRESLRMIEAAGGRR